MFNNLNKNIEKDKEYYYLINHILENEEFQKIGECVHHGTSRLNHSLRVSYYSYKIAKKLKLDFESTARAGLVHDFFYNENGGVTKDGIISTFTHSKKAVKNAEKYFGLNYKEKDIVEKHMFPLNIKIPMYKESYIVSTVDKFVSFIELNKKMKSKIVLLFLFIRV